jgi:hypothetical protein
MAHRAMRTTRLVAAYGASVVAAARQREALILAPGR